MDIGSITRDFLDPIGVWVGLIAAIPIGWTWWEIIIGRKRRHKIWLEAASSTQAKIPAVLIVDLLAGKNVEAPVKRFLSGIDQLKNLPKARFIKINREKHLAPGDMPELARDIQDAVSTVLRLGADELHVFLAGPGVASAMVGAELANIGCRVLLYQNDPASNTYVNFGPARHPRF